MKKSILITGASGFIGSFLVEEALKRGFETWAGVRKSSSLKYLQDNHIHLINLDFSSIDALSSQLGKHVEKHGKWDIILHCAGVTKCNNSSDFIRYNYQATVNLIVALREQGMRPDQFIYISSLSIFGPIHETPQENGENGLLYKPITEEDEPQPNTAYGQSKVRTERYLKSLVDYPYLIYRPTGVYGPRERDYFLMAKSIKQHIDFSVGYQKQEITFVYVKDLVQAIFLGIEKGVTRREYFVSDGQVYESRAFSDLLQKELGNPWVLHIKAPLWVLKTICTVGGFLGKITKQPIALNPDKYCIMKQRNWQCDIQPLRDELGYEPQYPLERGVKEAVAWYKENSWL
ncbi:MAG: NAD(P)-dependent oxidoreductase [Bacteroidaceae bacterium]|nr:NAD(P)-dependent oxidoreductase [Bacteroidaceae bacterium]